MFVRFLNEAAEAGEIPRGLDAESLAKTLLTLISGAQAMAVLMPAQYPSGVFEQMLREFFEREMALPQSC
jgi:hypothetical protein